MESNEARLHRELEALLARDPDARPFVCEGDPLACRVFIVGTNPATQMTQPFGSFWTLDGGFNKEAWLKSYEAHRAKQGKRRRSPTREVIERVIEAAPSIGFLETNVFAAATAKESDLDAVDRDSSFFSFLVDLIRPAVIVAHGREAHRGVSAALGIEPRLAPSKTLAPVEVPEGPQVMAVPHFSRGWSYKPSDGGRAGELGRRVASLVVPATS